MFDFFRANIRWLMGSLLVLLVIAFVAPQGYTSFMDQAGTGVASVDGNRITQAEWDAEHSQQVQRIRQQNPEADAKELDSPESRKASLDNLKAVKQWKEIAKIVGEEKTREEVLKLLDGSRLVIPRVLQVRRPSASELR